MNRVTDMCLICWYMKFKKEGRDTGKEQCLKKMIETLPKLVKNSNLLHPRNSAKPKTHKDKEKHA